MSGPFLGEQRRTPAGSWGGGVDSLERRPFTVFGFLPWGGRSTAIKLSTGDVWVLASTPLTEDTKATLDRLGPVKYGSTLPWMQYVPELHCVGGLWEPMQCTTCILVTHHAL